MSFVKYPKNWRANGYGWHNQEILNNLSQSANPNPATTTTNSIQQSQYPQQNNQQANYGYPPNAPAPGGNLYPSIPALPTGKNDAANLSYGFQSNYLPYPNQPPPPGGGGGIGVGNGAVGIYPAYGGYGIPGLPGLPGSSSGPSMPPPLPGFNSHIPSLPQLPSMPYQPQVPQVSPMRGPVVPPATPASPMRPAVEPTAAGIQEIPCQAVHVPPEENFFTLGERNRKRLDTSNKTFAQIRDECLRRNEIFEDPEFPANDSSLMFSRRPNRPVQWLRPMEISDNPQFFVEGYSRFDVQQGELGDCWLLAAAANLTQLPKLFFRVVPEDQNFEDKYAGVFHFRFWQYGEWVEVVIDDRLPTYRGELLYMRSTEKNEFWSALLEKAYAKLHGSYEALKGGSTCEAMEDFTGGVTEMYDLNEAPPNLFTIMMKAMERNSMMGCSIEPDPHVLEAETPQGLIKGHAYSITKVQLVDIRTPNKSGKIPLLRIRNPWGNEAEWKGAWSDRSNEWRYINEDTKRSLGITFDDDGEFWMSFDDFLRYFDRIEICNLTPDCLSQDQLSKGKKRWEMSLFEGEWTPGVTAGGCRNYLDTFWHNPQYTMTLTEPDSDDTEGKCTAIVGLMQKNRRLKKNQGVDMLTIGFAIYRLTERDMYVKPQRLNFFKYNASVARSAAFINLREVSCRFKLPPGNYLIVPSTFEPNEAGEFLIRVFSETKNNMEENDEEMGLAKEDERITPEPVSPQKSTLERIFIDIAGEGGEIGWSELKQLLDHSMRDVMGADQQFSKDMCRAMVALMDVDGSGRMNYQEFEVLLNDIAKWKGVFKFYDRKKSGRLNAFELREALNSAGYRLNNKVLNALAHRYGCLDGEVCFDDFIMCAIKTKTMIKRFKEKERITGTATFNLDDWLEQTVYA